MTTAWQVGHEDHDVELVSVSSGEKAQCNTCKKVLAWWSSESESDEPFDYIPSGITYTGSIELTREET